MATVTGQRDTLNISQDQRKIDMAASISLLEPDAQPLAVLSRRAGKAKAVNPLFKWMEDTSEARLDSTTTTQTSGSTTIAVANGAYFAEHYIAQITRTGENFRVTAVSGNNLTVVRGVGSTAAAINNADEIYILGIAQPEGDDNRPPRSSNPSTVQNYTQIFREPWSLTETARSSDNQVTPHDWNHQANKHGIEHAKDIELNLLFGGAAEDTSSSHPRRTTKGAVKFIVTNVTAAGGTLTETTFGTFTRTLFRYGGRNKVLLASPLLTSVLNAFAQGKLQIRQGETTYGLAVMNYVSPFGTLGVVTHNLLQGTKYGGYGVALEFDEIKYRYLDGGVGDARDTHILTNRQGNSTDGRLDEYLTECGLQFGSESKHGLLTGVTG
jgi:hypothetical protein